MRHCYQCDEEISGSGFRRSVGTGRSRRVSVGRRVSTSTTQRSGLRTLCAACAERADAATRLKNKVMGGGAIVFVGFVILANMGKRGPTVPTDTAVNHPAPVVLSASAPEPRTAGYGQPSPAPSFQPMPAPSLPMISSAEAAIIAPAAADAAQRAAVPALASFRNGAIVPWRHKTASGTRWSLRQVQGNVMALLVDLGGNQVASVLVAPEFQNLDLPGMDGRIEYVKSEALRLSPASAVYTFTRSGGVSPYP